MAQPLPGLSHVRSTQPAQRMTGSGRVQVLALQRLEPPGRGSAAVAGFTVIELLIVMVVIAILASITYIRVAPALERARVRAAANVLAGDLQYAQLMAARIGEPIVFTVDVGPKEYQIAERDGDSVYRLRRFGANGEYVLGEFTAVPTTVQLFPNAIVSQSATYTLGIGSYRRRVILTQAGQVRIKNVP